MDALTGARVLQATSQATDDDGVYRIQALDPERTYKVEFDTCRRRPVGAPRTFYDATGDLAAARVLAPTAEQPVTGADGLISGPGPTGQPYITGGPADGSTSNDPRGRFTLGVDGPSGSINDCVIDGIVFGFCVGTFTTPPLADGPHTFTVRPWGSTDPDAGETRTWTVDRAAPDPDPPVDPGPGDPDPADPGPGDPGPGGEPPVGGQPDLGSPAAGTPGTPPVAGPGPGAPAPGPGLLAGPRPLPPTTTAPPRSPSAAAPAATIGRMPTTRLATALAKGLRVPVTCSTACAVRATVRVDGRTARRLGLTRRSTPTVVARGTLRGTTTARTLTARYTSKARRALRSARSVRFVVALEVAGGDPQARTIERKVRLRR